MENYSKINDRILKNGRLFNALLENKNTEEKLKKIQKCLDQGADINAADANNNNNTALHVAVLLEDITIVNFLLCRGADIKTTNNDSKTPFDVVKSSITRNAKTICDFFEKHYSNISAPSPHQEIIPPVQRNKNTMQPNINLKDDQIPSSQTTQMQEYVYRKRCGTSGIRGQLYETKLISLILFRALYTQKVSKFVLGTNVDGMGAFDDVVFKYITNGETRPKVMFIQAKHRDDPTKDKIAVEDFFKHNGEFSLYKYLDSYIQIRQQFSADTSDNLFKDVLKDTECNFLIYTSAMENFSKKLIKEHSEEQYFLNTAIDGKVFRFDYNEQDVELLIRSIVTSRATLLAKKFMKYISRDNCNSMMTEEIIKTYHVFLAQHVVSQKCMPSDSSYVIGHFRETFLQTEDEILIVLKETICKELAIGKNKTTLQQKDIEEELRALSFKMPASFGNLKYCFTGNDHKRQRRLTYLCAIFQKLFKNLRQSVNYSAQYIVLKIDDEMVGPNGVLQVTDLEPYRLGGLVGNLLIYDTESKMLKFNIENNLPIDCIELREKLQEADCIGSDLSKYRLDINVHGFPKLALMHAENDKKLVNDFLCNVVFYTNQATEDVVERIAIEEIDKYFNEKVKQDAAFRFKAEAIYMKVHDKIQKWWKQPKSASYLTENCKFYLEAINEILDSPLLSIINFTYLEQLKNFSIEFNDSAVKSLELDSFMSSSNKVLTIISDEIKFTSIKLLQYFKAINHESEYTFMDMDLDILGHRFKSVIIEVNESKADVLIICKDSNSDKEYYKKIKSIIDAFQKKIIIITSDLFAEQIQIENIVTNIDKTNRINNLIPKYRENILKRKIEYQGYEIALGPLLNEETASFVDSKLLSNIILDIKKLSIGETLTSSAYAKAVYYYIEQSLCRCVILKTIEQTYVDMLIVKSCDTDISIPTGIRDIVVLSDTENEFDIFSNKHKHLNVHWFRKEDEYVWKKSDGDIKTIIKHVSKGTSDTCSVRVKTLSDLKEKIVIISAEPGMGKSTLLTHLAIHTKQKYPTLWILKIDLIEHIDTFSKLKDSNKIDYKAALKFMYRAAGLSAFKGIEGETKSGTKLIDKIIDTVICLDTQYKNYIKVEAVENILSGLELFEIMLFHHLYNNSKVALLLDGFDEICPDYADIVINMVNTLKNSKVAHLWITTRSYNVLLKLEEELGIFSYTLNPLTPADQYLFLQRIWSNKFDLNVMNMLFDMITMCLGDKTFTFTSIPLHLHMIAEVFQNVYMDSVNSLVLEQRMMCVVYQRSVISIFNLISLYERFIDMKFMKIRFGEKKQFIRGRGIEDPDMRRLIKKDRAEFIEVHKKIAAYTLYDKSFVNEWFTKQEIYDLFEIITSGDEKTGIIERIIGNEPKFSHMTFAEYFACEFLCDRLLSKHCTPLVWECLINHVCTGDNSGVRRFFNSKLVTDPSLMLLTSNKAYMNTVFDTLISQRTKTVTALSVAVEEYLENIALFLLKCVKSVLTADNIDKFLSFLTTRCRRYCVLCTCVEYYAVNTMKSIVDVITYVDAVKLKKIFYCDELPIDNVLSLAIRGIDLDPKHELLTLLFNVIQSNKLIVELLILPYNSYSFKSVAHFLGWNKKALEFVYNYLLTLDIDERMKIFSVVDEYGKLPAHYAAYYGHYNFFYTMERLLDIEQFRKICMTYDTKKFTPIFYMQCDKSDFKKFKYFLEKIYDEQDINVHEFVMTRLRKVEQQVL